MARPRKTRNKLLQPSQAIHALHPQVPKNEVLHALRERVKELTALHSTVCVLQDDRLPTADVLDRIVKLIPPAWQYPEITAGRIIVGDCESRSRGFRRTRWLQACDFRISRDLAGRIEVYYLKKMPKEAEGPFLAEVRERELRQKEILSYQEKLRGLSAELILTEERERREIATDLHDVIGQTLAMAKMKAGALRGYCAAEEASSDLKNLSGFIDEAILATRNLTFQLASPILYELGLESALERLAEDTRRRHGLEIDFRGEGRRVPLPTETSVLIFKAVRELLMNAVKHSKASAVRVRVRRAAGRIAVTVRDNGLGFNAAAASVYDGDKGGFGLFSIREKVSRLGGAFRLSSRPGSGTLAVITAPLGKDKRNGKKDTHLRRP